MPTKKKKTPWTYGQKAPRDWQETADILKQNQPAKSTVKDQLAQLLKDRK